MLEVIVVCEGQTEREFCREVIGPALHVHDVMLSGTLVGKPQRKRGGIRAWDVYRNEVVRLAKERAARHVGVLVDYYAMPGSWPGRLTAPARPVAERGHHVEQALRADLADDLGERFHPCVQLHEFESLLFVDPAMTALSIAVGGGMASDKVVAARLTADKERAGGLVESINDDPENAPSKRLLHIMPGYDKVAWGVLAAQDVTLPVLRNGCPWLDRWVAELSLLGGGI